MPGELFHRTPIETTCATSMMVAIALGALLFMSALLVSLILTTNTSFTYIMLLTGALDAFPRNNA